MRPRYFKQSNSTSQHNFQLSYQTMYTLWCQDTWSNQHHSKTFPKSKLDLIFTHTKNTASLSLSYQAIYSLWCQDTLIKPTVQRSTIVNHPSKPCIRCDAKILDQTNITAKHFQYRYLPTPKTQQVFHYPTKLCISCDAKILFIIEQYSISL